MLRTLGISSYFPSRQTLTDDLLAGTAVFLVALPLCLGIALASNAPLAAGILGGIVGGLVVGALSGSHVSVSGPAAGLTAVVAQQITTLGSFETFLLALFLAGLIQLAIGYFRGGFIASYFPSSVINGLLFAIGIILILKQLPHLAGWDADYEGEMAFWQPDNENTFSELVNALFHVHYGPLLLGVFSIAILYFWDSLDQLKRSKLPSSLVVVALGVFCTIIFTKLGSNFLVAPHLVTVPVLNDLDDVASLLAWPNFAALLDPRVILSAFTIAIVASLETLLNLEAVDKIDPAKRVSPPNRELMAQGAGNALLGLVGGIPITSVVIRSSVNINAGAKTKWSAIFHGLLLVICIVLFPTVLNSIPLSCLAAILIMTGLKLSSPKKVQAIWRQGLHQFIPFAVTVVAIVLTDLLTGVLIGLGMSILFILYSHLTHPLRVINENHLAQNISRVVFGHQMSFLNRSALLRAFERTAPGGHIVLDASQADYIDKDILDLISELQTKAIARNITLSFKGFKDSFKIPNQVLYQDTLTHQTQTEITPAQFLQALQDGNARVCNGNRIQRDLSRQITATSTGQFPLGVVLSCMDSRAPVELVFDLGLGEIFSIRMAGNVVSEKILGSMEYACAVAGAKLIVVMGHTRCGAVSAAISLYASKTSAKDSTGCEHLGSIVDDIQASLSERPEEIAAMHKDQREPFEDDIASRNVLVSIEHILAQSQTLKRLVNSGQIGIVGCVYDVRTGVAQFIEGPQSAREKELTQEAERPEADALLA